MIKLVTYDAGHGVALMVGRRVWAVHFPFPVTWKAWRYTIRGKWRAFRCQHDLHDYQDGIEVAVPVHFYEYTCRHCGKEFRI